MDVREFVRPKMNPNIPQFAPGDTVKIRLKAMEGDKERLQHFQGVVIKMRKGVDGGSFTVRRVSYGIGVERTFPFQSPSVQNVEVLRHGKVRRAKLYYIRRLSAKRARLKERRERAIEQAAAQEEQAVPEEEQAVPEEEQAVSQEEQAVPEEEQVMSQEEQAVSQEEQVVSQEEQAVPGEERVMSQEEQATAQEEQAVSQEVRATPQEEERSSE
jgi:large subunit ribosomal protein L19